MSVIHTATALAVNPAFLQEIKDSNPDLWANAQLLRQVCRSPDEPTTVSRRLTRALDDLRDGLAMQFALEESYGYMPLPSPHSEVLSDLACRVQGQHAPLYLQLTDLAEQAEELQYRGVEWEQLQKLIERTMRFDEQLREHEKLEAELIARSFGSARS